MYWLRADILADDFREGRVSEKERFKYFLATFIAWVLISQAISFFGGQFGKARLIPLAITLVVTVAGILLCYRVNKGGDDRDFIARMVCLGWPVGIQLMVGFAVAFPLLILIFHLLGMPPEGPISDAVGRMIRWVFGLCLSLPYFLQISFQLGRISNPDYLKIWTTRV